MNPTIKILKKVNQKIKLFFYKNYHIWFYLIVNKKLFFKFSAMYHGIKMNLSGLDDNYNLRRNIHRIEKGLSFSNKKKIFAEKYILETVKLFRLAYEKIEVTDNHTIQWAYSVLKLYFSHVDNSEAIKEADELFAIYAGKIDNLNLVPYRSVERPKLLLTYSELMNLAVHRRSVRKFQMNRIVEEKYIEKAIDIARLSPSACNRQSFKCLFYNQPEIVKKLSDIPGGVRGYNLPSLMIIVGRYRGYFDERDINAPIIDGSLFSMSLLFALETLGLSSVCVNWPNLKTREREIRRIINLYEDEFIVMMIGIGYADPEGLIPNSCKIDRKFIFEPNQRLK